MRIYLCLFLCLANLHAEPFGEAKVTKTIGNVNRIGKTLVQTGPNAKVELDFLDGSIARIGANARFSFSPGSRETRLDSGTLLFSSPKDAGGIIIRSAGVTTTAIGAVDLEVANINGNVKVICLSGKPLVYLMSNLSIRDGLRPGQILSIPSGATKLPRADIVDLKVLLSTSTLMQMGTMPSKAVLDRNAKKQGGTLPISLPGGANNILQSGQTTQNLAMVQEQQRQAAQVAADQLAAQQLAKQQLALQQQQAQQLAAEQLAAEQAKAKQIAAEQQAAQLAQANANTNQGKGPQGNNGQGPQGQGPKDHVPPGQAKK